MLHQQPILIVEDEPFIAIDLALAIEDAGGEVVGPAASAKEALELLEHHPVVAAILDVNLVDGDVSPVVDYLSKRDVPFIIQTGGGVPSKLREKYPGILVRIKPNVASDIAAELETMLAGPQEQRSRSGNAPN